MPIDIPILYTGKDAATPNWNNFWANQEARKAQVRQQKQQQAQFDALQNERILKDFLGSIDIDTINTTNEGVQNSMYEMYQGVEDIATSMLTESGGEPSTKDRLEMQQLVNRANQEVAVKKASLAKQKSDMALFQKNVGWYDQDKIKKNVYEWDGNGKYSYNLEDALLQVSPEQVALKIEASIKDPNIYTEISNKAGIRTTKDAKVDPSYYNYNEETGELENNDRNQVAYIKTAITEDNGGFRYLRTLDENWASQDDNTKQSYENKAVKAGLNKEDGRVLLFRDQNPNIFSVPTKTTVEPTKTSTSAKDKITTTRGVKKQGGRIVLDEIDVSPIEYVDGTTADNYVSFGNAAVKAVEAVINDPIDKSEGNSLGKTLSSSDFNNADFIGVDYSGEEPMLHFKVDFGTQNKQGKDGEEVFIYGRYPEGTQAQIEDNIREKYVANVKNNASRWRKRKDIELTSEEQAKLDSKIEKFRDKIDEGELVPVTEKKVKDILAPASSNSAYAKLYIDKGNMPIKDNSFVFPKERGNTPGKWTNLWDRDFNLDELKRGAKASGMNEEEYMDEVARRLIDFSIFNDKQLSKEDQAALQWLKDNPRDVYAERTYEKLKKNNTQ